MMAGACLSIVVALLAASPVPAGAAGPQRNVLLLVSDNQKWNDVGCYGNRALRTPHLDALARDSVRFQFAFATTASCGPSPAVLFTGLHVHQTACMPTRTAITTLARGPRW